MADTATKAELTDFLDDGRPDVQPAVHPARRLLPLHARPIPYATEYDGSDTQTCFSALPRRAGLRGADARPTTSS